MTPEQWEARRKGIGASDVPRILGLSSFGGPWDVWAEKVGVLSQKTGESERARMGRRFQPTILAEYAERFERKTKEIEVTQQGPEDWILATPDFVFLDEERTGGEIKNVGYKTPEWGEVLSDTIPERYYAQVQWQALACGFEKVVLVALFSGWELIPYVINGAPDYQAEIAAFCRQFWTGHVLNQVAPDPGESDEARKWLLRQYPEGVLPPRPAEGDEATLVGMYLQAKEQEDAAKKVVHGTRNALLARAGAHKGITGPDWKVTIANVKGSTYTVTREPTRSVTVHKTGGG